jgi:hypothetical protein
MSMLVDLMAFRANAGGGIPQGKPWAKLAWPLRATDEGTQAGSLCYIVVRSVERSLAAITLLV